MDGAADPGAPKLKPPRGTEVACPLDREAPAVVDGAFSCRLAPPGKGAAPVGVEEEGGGPLLAAAWGGCVACNCVVADGPTTVEKEKGSELPEAAGAALRAGT